MTESMIGRLPSGWREVPLGEVCGIQAGPSRTESLDTRKSPRDVPVVNPKSIKGRRITAEGVTYAPAAKAERLARYLIASGDVLCVRTGDLGRSGLTAGEHKGWLFGSGCLRLRATSELNARYLVHYLNHPSVAEWIKRASTGSVIASLSVGSLFELPVVLPPLTEQSAIGDLLSAFDEKVAVHEDIIGSTRMLQRELLRLLMSGQRSAGGLL